MSKEQSKYLVVCGNKFFYINSSFDIFKALTASIKSRDCRQGCIGKLSSLRGLNVSIQSFNYLVFNHADIRQEIDKITLKSCLIVAAKRVIFFSGPATKGIFFIKLQKISFFLIAR